MRLSHLFAALRSRSARQTAVSRDRRRAFRNQLLVERLEDRSLLATLFVDGTAAPGGGGLAWDSAFDNLQSALATAHAGDEIWVEKGTYTPTTGADRAVSFNLESGVGIYGGFAGTETALSQRDPAAYPTILSGDIGTSGDNADNSYHVVYASGIDGTAVLDGFTITGGNANDWTPGQGNVQGAGIKIFDYSSPTLTNLTISGNSADDEGGGIGNYNHSSPTLTNVVISGNTAGYGGGGIWNQIYSSPTLTNVTISGNSAPYGGGIDNDSDCSPMLTNAMISGNTAAYGGGIFNENSSPSLTNVTISGNSASSYSSSDFGGGGGIFNDYNSSPTLTNVTISGNSASYASAIDNQDYSSPTLTNVTISGNFASANGVINNRQHSSPKLTNVTISGNSTDYVIYNALSSSATLTNVILWGNTLYSGSQFFNYDTESTVSATYSDIQGGWAGTGNINADPLFVDAAAGNLRLTPGSPAIDAGTNIGAPSFDLDGTPRPLDGNNDGTAIVDIGAYEYQKPNSPPIASNQGVTANEDMPQAITLTATDADGNQLTYSIVSYPSHGTLTNFDPQTGTVVYTPAPNFHGDDSFTFKANDGIADSNIATVSVTVLSAAEQVAAITDQVRDLVNQGLINQGQANALLSSLDGANAQLAKGNTTSAVNMLNAFENKVYALRKSGRLSPEEANALISLTEDAINSALSGSAQATDAALAALNHGGTFGIR